MNILQQVPRNALVWIIICQFALVAPHAGRLPVWVLAVYVAAVVVAFAGPPWSMVIPGPLGESGADCQQLYWSLCQLRFPDWS